MQLSRNILQQVLEIAAEKEEAGFEEKEIAHLFGDEYDLVFHLDYLNEKGFIAGEFTPGAYAAFAILPEPIHFIRGKITLEGRQYLQGLQQSSEAAAKSQEGS
ncbi:hypothetical protein [Thermocoleostomius sinensis]|uniref:DUF2513 domain-containing protein n=1 Tax=Thermocoleostomius sinensis A174 TaxID=2016057 RepID=A0A9E8ZAA1_9CYAN|nr:hypothetical protein [Thermocoleostomius sinensis]WAL58289.1 hypothetical protein OXH18_13955 [Thermocoleostomius sinensis A174]